MQIKSPYEKYVILPLLKQPNQLFLGRKKKKKKKKKIISGSASYQSPYEKEDIILPLSKCNENLNGIVYNLVHNWLSHMGKRAK